MSSIELQRTSVLGAPVEGSTLPATEFDIEHAKPAARFALRMDPDTATELSSLNGFEVAQSINQIAGESRQSMRLGPDEWFLIAEDEDPAAVQAELRAALTNRAHALVDVSHRNVALVLKGSRARDVLSTGCPLDLHSAVFSPGTATRTVFAKCEVVLARLPGEADDTIFRIECWRSFGRYLEGFLRNSARLQGIGS